uniref:glycosyltransferase n=1 Tax=Faecalicatena contorta TaxID=39482 RepID=UPI00359C3480
MYDTARRVALVKQRVRENTRRRQRREVGGLSAVCLLLLAALMESADALIAPGQTAAWGSFGAMLLREDAGGYVLVAVVSFAAAAVITALCFRLRNRENQKKDGADKPNRHEKEEKSQ